MLAYYFPPVKVVGAQRLFYFYREAQAYTEAIEVITADNHALLRHDPSLQPDGVRLHLARTRDLRTWFVRKQGGATSLSSVRKQSALVSWLLRLRQSIPFVFLWGDGGPGYVLDAYRQASRLIREQGITHVFSSYRPWSDHLTAWLLKRRFPRLIWIADFRDLPVDPRRRDLFFPGFQNRVAARLLRPAQVVQTVSEGLAEVFSQQIGQPVSVLRNGMPGPPPMYASVVMGPSFSISYTGALYPGLQQSALLLSSLRRLINAGEINPVHLQLVYAGKDADLWEQHLFEHDLRHLGRSLPECSLEEAQQLQRQSQLNLLLSWSAAGYTGILTAKVYDYLAAGRPILALVDGPPDPELHTMIESSGGGRVFSTTEPEAQAAMEAWLLQGYRAWAWSGAWPWQASSSFLQAYTWKEQARVAWEGYVGGEWGMGNGEQ